MSRRCYVDNAANRSLGRVGQPLGSHVVSSSRSYGSSYGSSAGSTSQRCYVDNSYNRQLGRVGQSLGSHVVSSSGSRSCGSSAAKSTSQGCYVDNSYNRQLGRVGKPLGTHVVSRSGEVAEPRSSESTSQRCYVDNAYNRQLGRVGKPLGTHVVSSSGTEGATSGQRCYVDNAYNRRLGRVGKPLGTHIVSKSSGRTRCRELLNEHTLQDLVEALHEMGLSDANRPSYQYVVDRLEQERVEENWMASGVNPSTDVLRLKDHNPGKIIPYSELKLDQKAIGRGGFGEVYVGLWHGTPIAFKKLLYQRMSKKLHDSFTKEVSILATLDHPNTVKMFGAVVEEGNIGIVMEYMHRSLHKAIFWEEVSFPEEKKKKMVSQMACALQYLHTHEKRIAHCDVKSDNVLLDKDDNAKLSDFGISAVKNATETSRSSVAGAAAPPGQGTPRYSAPEVLRGELLTMNQLLQTDIYSLAIVVFEVVTEEEPFQGLNVRQLEANVGRGKLRPTASSTELSKSVADLLKKCWDDSASHRPTAGQFQEEWNSVTVLCGHSK